MVLLDQKSDEYRISSGKSCLKCAPITDDSYFKRKMSKGTGQPAMPESTPYEALTNEYMRSVLTSEMKRRKLSYRKAADLLSESRCSLWAVAQSNRRLSRKAWENLLSIII